MTKPKIDIVSVRLAIEAVGNSPTKLGEYLGVNRSTITRYFNRYPELAQAAQREPARDDDRTKHSREAVQAAIEQSHGVKAAVAAALTCDRRTVDNYLERWPDLAELFEAQRHKLVGSASSALVKDIADPTSKGHQPAYFFVLKTMGKDEGFVERQEVTGADGRDLVGFSPESMRLMGVLGIDPAAALGLFENMLKARVAQLGVGA